MSSDLQTVRSRRTGRSFSVGLELHHPARADESVARWFYSTVLPADSRRDFTFYRLPETSTHLYVVVEMRAGQPTVQARISAPNAHLRRVPHEPRSAHIVGVELLPGAAAVVLGTDLSQLRPDMPLAELWGSEAFELEHCLVVAPAAERVRVLRQQLAPRFQQARADVHAMRIAAFVREAVPLSIPALARKMECSPRQLQRRWRRFAGMTPRMYHRLSRLKAVLAALAATDSSRVGWKELARPAGYSDHAHLVRDFADLMGIAPAHLMRAIDFVPQELDMGWLLVPRAMSDAFKAGAAHERG